MIKIIDKKQCCGCGACANKCVKKCISMVEDSEGFLYPEIDSNKCIDCGLCKKTCPIINHVNTEINRKQVAVLVQNRDKDILQQSTAGGAFTAISEYVIDQGGVVFGVEIGSDFCVKHTHVETVKELQKYRNSKYVQSFIGDTYVKVKEELMKNKLVCFSGTPCQIEGLRAFLNREYENLILVDVVCRAVPSPGVWKRYIDMESKKLGNISSIRFRDKTLGYQYSTMEIRTMDGNIQRGGIESQTWLRMFFSGMIIRPSCTECKFRSRYRNSDFTIWDCFNSYKFDKSIDENIGTTRMLIHTDKGKHIFEKIEEKLDYKIIDADMAVTGVKELTSSPSVNPMRAAFFEDYGTLSMKALVEKYFPDTLKIKLKCAMRLYLNKIGLDIVIKRILKRG